MSQQCHKRTEKRDDVCHADNNRYEQRVGCPHEHRPGKTDKADDNRIDNLPDKEAEKRTVYQIRLAQDIFRLFFRKHREQNFLGLQ